MECPLCFEGYEESGVRCPHSLPCGHTFCRGCLENLTPKRCPQRCAGTFKRDVPKNFALIDQLSAQRTARHVDPMAGCTPSQADAGPLCVLYKLPALASEDGTMVVGVTPTTATQGALRARPVVVLDRSPSMGGALRWVINAAVPEALLRVGYTEGERVTLITFDSVTERVRIRGRDPTIGELRTIPVTGRGNTTRMADAVHCLASVLAEDGPLGAFNVAVISDGFVEDMAAMKRTAAAALRTVPPSARVAMALIRFFNGAPPDTVALAICGSFGTTGNAPVVDCMPPEQWSCGVCTFLNATLATTCEMCGTRPQRDQRTSGKEDSPGPLHTFVTTFADAFEVQMLPHATITHEHGLGRSLPLALGFHTPATRLDVPVGATTYLAMGGGRAEAVALQVNETWVRMPVNAARTMQGEAGLGLQAQAEGELLEFFKAMLMQLRLWLLAGTRASDLRQVVQCCSRLVDGHGATGEVSMGVLQKAWALRKRLERVESPLSRIVALVDAEGFVSELGSKQQGDFLRAASVAKSDRLLARRALGPDIMYHDACRAALKTLGLPPQDNSLYTDSLRAAKSLAPAADDLTAPQILQVVGGVGVPFVSVQRGFEFGDEPWRNDPWSIEVVALGGCGPGECRSESDVWTSGPFVGTAKATGVIPLTSCGPAAHVQYMTELRMVAVLHLGAQLQGSLPSMPWGWANLFVGSDGMPAPELALGDDPFLARLGAGFLCCCRTRDGENDRITTELLEAIRRTPQSAKCSVLNAARSGSGITVLTNPTMQSYQNWLRVMTAMAASGEVPTPDFELAAYYCQVVVELKRQLPPANKGEMLLALLCPQHEDKRTFVSPAAAKAATEDGDGFGLRHCQDVYAAAELAKRAQMHGGWVPGVETVVGHARALGARVTQRTVFDRDPEVSDAWVAAAVVGALVGVIPDRTRDPMQFLRKVVEDCFAADYKQRLQIEARALLREESAAVLRQQRLHVPGTETGTMYDVFSSPDFLAVLRHGRAPWAPKGWYTTTRRPRSF